MGFFHSRFWGKIDRRGLGTLSIPRTGFLPHSCCGFCLWAKGLDAKGPCRTLRLPLCTSLHCTPVDGNHDVHRWRPQVTLLWLSHKCVGSQWPSGTGGSCSKVLRSALASKSWVQGSLPPWIKRFLLQISKGTMGNLSGKQAIRIASLFATLLNRGSLPFHGGSFHG